MRTVYVSQVWDNRHSAISSVRDFKTDACLSMHSFDPSNKSSVAMKDSDISDILSGADLIQVFFVQEGDFI